jgi:hypothetical protein
MGALKEWMILPSKLRAARLENENLSLKCQLQALVIEDVTSVTNRDKKYKGNAYQTYSEAVKELADKYEGKADWGVVQTGNIIDVRASFISAGGLKVYPNKAAAMKQGGDEKNIADGKKKPDLKTFAANEMEFVQRFLEANSLDHEMVQQFAKEGELEGRFLGEVFWDKEAAMVMLRFKSWADTQYKVKPDAKDYSKFLEATWKDAADKPVTLKEDSFVYAKFAGRVHKADDPYPKVAKCLTQIEYLDKAIRDWREINRLFASPVPDLEFPDAADAKKAADASKDINWKTKKLISHTGKFSFKAPEMTGTDSLDREITMLAKMISGTTGVPVHFMGLPDLMSNRATAENLMELVSAATSKERAIWKGLYQSVIKKAIAMWNAQSGKTQLDASKLTVDIPYITQETWAKIRDVYLPLYNARAISLETLLAQLPDIDIDEELARKEKRDAEAMERFASTEDEDGNKEDDKEEE